MLAYFLVVASRLPARSETSQTFFGVSYDRSTAGYCTLLSKLSSVKTIVGQSCLRLLDEARAEMREDFFCANLQL
jgi:hypothetical protein